jgi:hypothetical protein
MSDNSDLPDGTPYSRKMGFPPYHLDDSRIFATKDEMSDFGRQQEEREGHNAGTPGEVVDGAGTPASHSGFFASNEYTAPIHDSFQQFFDGTSDASSGWGPGPSQDFGTSHHS